MLVLNRQTKGRMTIKTSRGITNPTKGGNLTGPATLARKIPRLIGTRTHVVRGQTKISRGFVPPPPSKFDIASSNEFNRKSSSHPGRVQINSIADRWSEITQDQWILDVVQEGLQLNFQIPPHMSGTRVTCTQNNVQSQCLLEEVESLLGKQAIERVPQGQEGLGFYSTFFTVQKKGGGLRPILNLRPLNKFLKVQHFKMETLR